MHLKVSKRRASSITVALTLILLAFNSFTGNWWPYVLLTIGVPLAFRQFLTGRLYESILSLAVFGGLYLVFSFTIDWSIILPVIFSISAIFILFKEFCNPYAEKEPEHEEDINIENMEDKDN